MKFKFKSTTVFKVTTRNSGMIISFDKDEYIQVNGRFTICFSLLENPISSHDLLKKLADDDSVETIESELMTILKFLLAHEFVETDEDRTEISTKADLSINTSLGALELVAFEEIKFDVYATESWEPEPGYFSDC